MFESCAVFRVRREPSGDKAKAASGRYSSSREVVCAARRLMETIEQREAEKLSLLRKAWDEGIGSGGAGEVDFSDLKQEARASLNAGWRFTAGLRTDADGADLRWRP
jgi:antitoxin ParD1/3/4